MIIERKKALKNLTTFKVGGDANYFCRVSSINELKEAIIFSKDNSLQVFVLGGGSNILVSDFVFNGLVIKMEFKGVHFYGEEIIASAGENWDSIVELSVKKNLYGIENLSFIPGTVGGGVSGNIGAYGNEIKDVTKWVEVFDIETLKILVLNKNKCKFDYRDSIFKNKEGKKYIVTKVCLKLSKDKKLNLSYRDLKKYFESINTNVLKNTPTLTDVRIAVNKIRANKFPNLEVFGTAGSYFKNPVISNKQANKLSASFQNLPLFVVDKNSKKVALAWLLDCVLHLKGKREGNVGLYENQPLVFVNFGDSTAKEIKTFADNITKKIYDKTKIKITPEVILIGKF